MIRLVCPIAAAHGPVLAVKDPASRWGWYCPAQAHDGRLRGHPAGPAPRTRALFTTAEVEAGVIPRAQRSAPLPASEDQLAGTPSGDREPDPSRVAYASGGVVPPMALPVTPITSGAG